MDIRKISALALSAVLASAAFAGCDDEEDSKKSSSEPPRKTTAAAISNESTSDTEDETEFIPATTEEPTEPPAADWSEDLDPDYRKTINQYYLDGKSPEWLGYGSGFSPIRQNNIIYFMVSGDNVCSYDLDTQKTVTVIDVSKLDDKYWYGAAMYRDGYFYFRKKLKEDRHGERGAMVFDSDGNVVAEYKLKEGEKIQYVFKDGSFMTENLEYCVPGKTECEQIEVYGAEVNTPDGVKHIGSKGDVRYSVYGQFESEGREMLLLGAYSENETDYSGYFVYDVADRKWESFDMPQDDGLAVWGKYAVIRKDGEFSFYDLDKKRMIGRFTSNNAFFIREEFWKRCYDYEIVDHEGLNAEVWKRTDMSKNPPESTLLGKQPYKERPEDHMVDDTYYLVEKSEEVGNGKWSVKWYLRTYEKGEEESVLIYDSMSDDIWNGIQ